ncbi:MAG TPA: aminoacyl-tRNA hydrolase [Casimicrobiaceae bacterium]|nr:aminoacyl-tRNA hydrolase [Casimicrobiaceae bacterium]
MALPLRLLIGLGNPGRRYAATRHNAGAWFVDRLAGALRLELRSEARFHSMLARGRAPDGGDFRLALPQSYMNESGHAVAALARYYRVSPAEILVAHDELDLKPGSVKLKLGGGSAGHNGLKDIVAQLGSGQFWRLRIGIGHPRDAEHPEAEVVDYVLYRPRPEEKERIDEAIARALSVWSDLVVGNTERAMLALHTRPAAAQGPGEGKPAA